MSNCPTETLLEHAGGQPELRRFVDAFYTSALTDPLLQPLFGAGRAGHVDHLTAFTAETFGGPPAFTDRLGFTHLIDVHRGLCIIEPQRRRFVTLFLAAADAAELPADAPFQAALRAHVEFGSRVAMQNSHARTDADLHPLREVPRWSWPDIAAEPEPPTPFPGHDGGTWAPVTSECVAEWPPGTFAENLAVAPHGDVFVSLHSHRRIDRYDPRSGATAPFVSLDAPVAGLYFGMDGVLWATGGVVGRAPGRVWRIEPDGRAAVWTEVADAVFLNGCALTPDGTRLLVCESVTGRVIAVELDRPGWSTWIDDARLRPERPEIPGANGIAVRGREVLLSVTDRDELLRVDVDLDGRPGVIDVVEDRVRADDFAVASDGALLIATHPADTVLRIDPAGTRTTIVGPAQGATGATACAFGRAPGDQAALYVTTNGGMSTRTPDRYEPAKLLRLPRA
jgi:hemoglobin